MLALKIEAMGNCKGLTDGSTTSLTLDVKDEEFKDVLGKALFTVESMGYPFKTADIYDEVAQGFDKLSLRNNFQKIYSDSVLRVSVKFY